MNTFIAYWREEKEIYQIVLYGFPCPGQVAPVLARMNDDTDCPEARHILVEQIEKELGGKIKILE